MGEIVIAGSTYWDVRDQIPDGAWRQRALGDIDRIVVHHSATGAMPDTSRRAKLALLQAFHTDHTADGPRHEAWPGIAYHALIFPDGGVAIIGGAETVRYHTGSHVDVSPRNGISDANDHGYGICLIGDYSGDVAPAPAVLTALSRLIGNVEAGLGASLPVQPHRQYGGTACPGGAWFETWQAQPAPEPAPGPDNAGELAQLAARLGDAAALIAQADNLAGVATAMLSRAASIRAEVERRRAELS